MDAERKFIAYAAFLAASLIISAYFLSASGFTIEDAADPSLFKGAIKKLISLNFLLFLASIPFTYSIAIAFSKHLEKIQMLLATLFAFIAALVVSIVLFQNMMSFIIPAVFYFASFLLLIEASAVGFAEFKKYTYLRVSFGSTGNALLVLGIGIFIFSSIHMLANQQKYINNLEELVFSTIGGGKGGLDYAEIAADLAIKDQRQTLEIIMQTNYFRQLETKNDPDVESYVAFMNTLRTTIETPEYKDQLKKQLEGQTGGASETTAKGTFQIIKQRFPWFAQVESYMWLIQSFFLLSTFLLIGNIIFKPLAFVFTFLISAAVDAAEKNS